MLILKRKKAWMPAGLERVRACFHPTLYSYIRLPCTWLASLYVDIPARFVEQAQDAEFRHFEKSNTDACPFFCRACVYVPLFYWLSMFVLLHFIIVCPLYRAPVHTQSTWHCIATLFYCSFLVANCSPTLTLTVRYTHLPDKSINQGYTLNYWDKWAASYRYHLINILLFLWIDSYLLR